jgi:alpha-1,3-rhamnosyl/mannosyltransferase
MVIQRPPAAPGALLLMYHRPAMARSLLSTVRFFGHVLRDLIGSFRGRWSRFQRRLAGDDEEVVVAVDAFPFAETMTGVGWYEWSLLEALDAGDFGLSFNLYAHTFLSPSDPAAPGVPGRRIRLRTHQMPPDLLVPTGVTLVVLRWLMEPILRVLDGNDVLWAPNFFATSRQLPFGRSMVATVHDLAYAVMPDTVATETLRDLRTELPPTLFRSDRLIAVSEATAGDLVESLGANPRRIHVVHEGIDPEFADLEAPAQARLERPDRYLLFVSTLEPRKNVAGVITAFELAASWGYPGDLVLVGRWGWRTETIREHLDRSPVRSRILHLDYVPRASLPELYRNADALVFPSWMEGFGLPLLEAMACGVPVITSGRSAMPEVAGPAAVYVDPASPHSIATAVASLANDPDHRQRLVALGRERASQFSWDRAAEATAQTLRQAAGREASGDDEYRV